jgi:Endonuclease/Exonuclease/phosphatase family
MKVTVATWNAGNGNKDNLQKIMNKASLIALQEMGDRDNLYDYAKNHGWATYNDGGQDDRASTPVFFDKAFWKKSDDQTIKLSNQQQVNPGTGPETIKTKWALGPKFFHGDTGFNFWSLHLVADSSSGERHDLAKQQITNASDLKPGANGPCVVAGDWNTSWDNDLLKPMKNKGWQSNHYKKGGPVKTHGGWTPDQIWFRNATFVEQGSFNTGSDHDALWVTFDV